MIIIILTSESRITSINTPLKFWLVVTLPSLIIKSPNSNRGPFDSIWNELLGERGHILHYVITKTSSLTFVNFFDVYAGAILTIKRSKRLSAITDICFVPLSKMGNADAGYSEL